MPVLTTVSNIQIVLSLRWKEWTHSPIETIQENAAQYSETLDKVTTEVLFFLVLWKLDFLKSSDLESS